MTTPLFGAWQKKPLEKKWESSAETNGAGLVHSGEHDIAVGAEPLGREGEGEAVPRDGGGHEVPLRAQRVARRLGDGCFRIFAKVAKLMLV